MIVVVVGVRGWGGRRFVIGKVWVSLGWVIVFMIVWK